METTWWQAKLWPCVDHSQESYDGHSVCFVDEICVGFYSLCNKVHKIGVVLKKSIIVII